MQATLHTNLGDIVIDLFPDKAPVAVENFVGLATGDKEYSEPNPRGTTDGPFYDGCKFHCAIRRFIIQGGDPKGDGTGGPGYDFPDELHDMKFDRPYLVATAGKGPMSSGSQFFITLAPNPMMPAPSHLDGHHTIFGEVTDADSIHVVQMINALPTDSFAPIDPVVIQSVTVEESAHA